MRCVKQRKLDSSVYCAVMYLCCTALYCAVRTKACARENVRRTHAFLFFTDSACYAGAATVESGALKAVGE